MDESEFSLVVETPQGTMLRRIPAPLPLLNEQKRGIEAEEASRRAAARWGIPDFVFSPVQRSSGAGVREVGDGIVIAGNRAAVLQVKSRETASSDDNRERNWLDKNIAKGLSQARGTIRALRRQPAVMPNSRGREIEINGTDFEWLSVVIIDHDRIPYGYVPSLGAGEVPEVILVRRDWEFLFDHLRSTHAVVDYLARAAGESVPLGSEPIRYYEYAQADLSSQPDPLPMWSPAEGAIRSLPRAPMEPAGIDDTQAHELLRIIFEDIATSPLDSARESDRLLVLSQLDRIPIASRTELGRTLFAFMDSVNGWSGDGARTDSRIITPTHREQAALVFMIGSESSELTDNALLFRTQLLHHDFRQAPGHDEAMTIGVLLTPGRSPQHPWRTTMKAAIGDQGHSEADIAQLRELVLQSASEALS